MLFLILLILLIVCGFVWLSSTLKSNSNERAGEILRFQHYVSTYVDCLRIGAWLRCMDTLKERYAERTLRVRLDAKMGEWGLSGNPEEALNQLKCLPEEEPFSDNFCFQFCAWRMLVYTWADRLGIAEIYDAHEDSLIEELNKMFE